jgi:hypothetical protein
VLVRLTFRRKMKDESRKQKDERREWTTPRGADTCSCRTEVCTYGMYGMYSVRYVLCLYGGVCTGTSMTTRVTTCCRRLYQQFPLSEHAPRRNSLASACICLHRLASACIGLHRLASAIIIIPSFACFVFDASSLTPPFSVQRSAFSDAYCRRRGRGRGRGRGRSRLAPLSCILHRV